MSIFSPSRCEHGELHDWHNPCVACDKDAQIASLTARLTEQLRLANIDALTNEAELAALREEVEINKE